MKSLIFLAVVGCLANASAAISWQNNTLLQSIDEALIQATFANGNRQVLAAGLSPKCEKAALFSLAAAVTQVEPMKCDTTTELLQDVGAVLLQSVDSVSSLIVDLNTVLNGVPLCLTTYSWYNLLQLVPCLTGQFKEVWTAMSDFWNFRDYVGKPIAKAEELITCMKNRHSATALLVQSIVNDAKRCV